MATDPESRTRSPRMAAFVNRLDNALGYETAKDLVKILCEDFDWHYGSYSRNGPSNQGEVNEEWHCWHCGRNYHRTSKVTITEGTK